MADRITLSKKDFRRMQLVELDLLIEFDRVCRLHDIKYSLCSGTQLGAVRHKGFIPWDDDIDVCMLREEYEKFKTLAIPDLNSDICFFQDHTTDKYYRWGFGKIRRKGTTYIRAGQEHMKYKTGVFIDIIPYDDVPDNIIGQVFQSIYCFCLRKILWAQVGKKNEKGFLKVWYKMLSVIPSDWVFALLKPCISKNNNSTGNRVRGLMFPAPGVEYGATTKLSERFGMPKKWFTELNEYEFENHLFLGTAYPHEYLTYKFGDYMKLPPLDQREGHAPVSFIDLGNLHINE